METTNQHSTRLLDEVPFVEGRAKVRSMTTPKTPAVEPLASRQAAAARILQRANEIASKDPAAHRAERLAEVRRENPDLTEAQAEAQVGLLEALGF